ncbi:MAG: polysaccharide biosynthesis/export family protein [Thiolinea sp.]
MTRVTTLSLLAGACSLLTACASNAPRYPEPPLFTSQVQAYRPGVVPLAPASYQVPQAPLPLPRGAVPAGSDRIAVQDLLEVSVFKVPDLSRSIRVDSQGHITFP